ncbi:MAG: TQO small subunit DoxD, partial [Propionibacteriales bacterium]|nr:TQO small subunit DoxD [Propionibacteriales bacterium]
MSALTESSGNGGPIAAAEERLARAVPVILRLSVGFLWLTNAGWKVPPDFGQEAGRGLYGFTAAAVEHPVFSPFSWVVEQVILPNFTVFGWGVLILEASLGAFLLLGLATRFWALVGVAQSIGIGLSVANA